MVATTSCRCCCGSGRNRPTMESRVHDLVRCPSYKPRRFRFAEEMERLVCPDPMGFEVDPDLCLASSDHRGSNRDCVVGATIRIALGLLGSEQNGVRNGVLRNGVPGAFSRGRGLAFRNEVPPESSGVLSEPLVPLASSGFGPPRAITFSPRRSENSEEQCLLNRRGTPLPELGRGRLLSRYQSGRNERPGWWERS